MLAEWNAMGKITGFLEIEREERSYAPAGDRIRHFREFALPLEDQGVARQAARCMDCGIPFCQRGCPVDNQIPDWNDLVYRDDWETASSFLHSTNNFPEFTGRICPAPCEEACTLNLDDAPVSIKNIECAIVDKAWNNGWLPPEPAQWQTGKRVAVVGSGPSGLAAAQQLARVGHIVHVYEKQAKPGGLLRYGIPDFKLEKSVVARRVAQMEAEGVAFHCGVEVGGAGKPFSDLERDYDAVLLAGGSEKPRDLPVPGRELKGVHFAMDFLRQQNRRVSSESLGEPEPIWAEGKHVVVIGGGDTGSDCIGTSIRQGALSVTQIEILPRPPEKADKLLTWPGWPNKLRTSSSQREGAEREWGVGTLSFSGANGQLEKLHCARVDGRLQPVAGTEFELKADLALLAMGFLHPMHEGLLKDAGVELDRRGNVKATDRDYRTSRPKVFAAGDMRRGQSLVVWAIREGRQAAQAIDVFLMGRSDLPR
jgi:glutamate synthase (NADPH/NADH) small chain